MNYTQNLTQKYMEWMVLGRAVLAFAQWAEKALEGAGSDAKWTTDNPALSWTWCFGN